MTTHQQAFDYIAENLLKQGCKARNSGHCAYRGGGGLKCAAGFMIADDVYNEDMEGSPIQALASVGHPRSVPALANLVPIRYFLRTMQIIHDCMHERDWKEAFRIVGTFVGLDVSILNRVPGAEMPNHMVQAALHNLGGTFTRALYLARQERIVMENGKVETVVPLLDDPVASFMTVTTLDLLAPETLAEATKVVAKSPSMQKMLAQIYDLGKSVTMKPHNPVDASAELETVT